MLFCSEEKKSIISFEMNEMCELKLGKDFETLYDLIIE